MLMKCVAGFLILLSAVNIFGMAEELDQADALLKEGKTFEAIEILKEAMDEYEGTKVAKKARVKLAAVLRRFRPKKLEIVDKSLEKLIQADEKTLKEATGKKGERLAFSNFLLGEKHVDKKDFFVAIRFYSASRDEYKKLSEDKAAGKSKKTFSDNYVKTSFLYGDTALELSQKASECPAQQPHVAKYAKYAKDGFSVVTDLEAKNDDWKGLKELAEFRVLALPDTEQ